MGVTFASASQSLEWFDVDTVCRILRCTSVHVLQLVQNGVLNGRTVDGEARISSASVDAYTATRPLMGPAPPRTFVKVNARVYEEF